PLFESYQPYNLGDGAKRGLAILRDLSNIDKHRVLHGATFAIGEERPEVERRSGFDRADIERWYGPVEEGAEVFRVRLFSATPPSADDEVRLETVVTADIRFGDEAWSMSTLGGVL